MFEIYQNDKVLEIVDFENSVDVMMYIEEKYFVDGENPNGIFFRKISSEEDSEILLEVIKC